MLWHINLKRKIKQEENDKETITETKQLRKQKQTNKQTDKEHTAIKIHSKCQQENQVNIVREIIYPTFHLSSGCQYQPEHKGKFPRGNINKIYRCK